MDPNTPQPQNDRDDRGVPIPVVGPAPQQYQPIQQPAPSQPQMPPPVPGWFAAEPIPDDEPPRKDRTPIPFGRILKVLTFIILIGGIVGGVGYGLISIFNQSDQEADRLATAQEAFNEEVKKVIYVGDGTDIERTEKPKVSYACPTGYEESSSGKKCISRDKIIAVAKSYKCKSGYKKTGTDANPECSKITGGKKETVNASKVESCPSGYEKSGDKCQKSATVAISNAYTCPGGFNKSGSGTSTMCSKSTAITSALIVSCPSGFTLIGVGSSASCTKTTQAGTRKSYIPATVCNEGFSLVDKVSLLCTKLGDPYTTSSYYCESGWLLQGSSCTYDVSKTAVATGRYCTGGLILSGTGCYQWVAIARIKGVCYGTTKTLSGLSGCWTFRYIRAAAVTYTYTCPKSIYSIRSISSGACRVTKSASVNTTRGFACPSYSIKSLSSGNTYCNYYSTRFTTLPDCPDGTRTVWNGVVADAKCVQDGTVNYSCRSGLNRVGSGSGTICSKTVGETASPIVSGSCPSGTNKQGNSCVGTLSVNPEVDYRCESGYEEKNSKCERIVGGTKVTTGSTSVQTCPAGYEMKGTGDKAKCEQQENVTIGLQKVFTCKDGWRQKIDGKKVTCVLVRAS